VLITPGPGALREQFVVHKHPVHRWQAFPVTVYVKHSANVHSIHAVFMGSFWYLGSQFAGLAHDHVAVIVLLAYDPARLLRIARHHGGVHLLGVALLFKPQAHHVGLHARRVAEEILCSHARTAAEEVEVALEPVGEGVVAIWPRCWLRLCLQRWPY
jgi:hypothetical protein